ncbi:DNA mismatch endonuclease Vsr [Sphingomonas sp. MG17]|uniref:DNA mismatch endonuclease Vsr n=1 Tax=Sphingomonas tagetis TaxID=2949092 RepID=A0A9X2HRL8_9SPHN|nr:DNA mismatch endonuclease Vsr [Sphingomonas tagetis]MCP3733116.1 DNA mismatch endonuclease Vsr [Sphingomonas tagetis]
MTDVVDSAVRSRMMSGIRSTNTKPELQLRRALHARGVRYRLHDRSLPGKPDIVLPRWHAVIEVRGCFWHRHQGCRLTTTPATRPEFWKAKFSSNVERDQRNETLLNRAGWRIAVVWECALRAGSIDDVTDALISWLESDLQRVEIPSGQGTADHRERHPNDLQPSGGV